VKNASEYTGGKANVTWTNILICFHHNTTQLCYVKYEMSIALGIQSYPWSSFKAQHARKVPYFQHIWLARDLSCSYFQNYEFSVELKSSKSSGLKYVTILWQIFPPNEEGICKGHLEMCHQYFTTAMSFNP
jgi:hypothetical protein